MLADRDKALIARRFDRQAEVYESVTPVQNMMVDRLMTMVSETFPDATTPLSVLDLGCGPGRFSRRVIDAGLWKAVREGRPGSARVASRARQRRGTRGRRRGRRRR